MTAPPATGNDALVSSTRAGVSPTKWPSFRAQATTSPSRWVVPTLLYRRIAPSGPSLTTTRLATVWSAAMLRLDVSGRELPDGHTVTYPPRVGATTVTFMTTAAASAGTEPTPPIGNTM